MLTDHFKDRVTVSRGTVTGNKTAYATVGSEFSAHIQPISDSYGQADAGRTGKSFRMFSTTEVRIGDRIIDQTGKKYECFGAVKHHFRGKSHYELSLRGV